MTAFEKRLSEALESPRLAAELPRVAAGFLEHRSQDAAAARLEGNALLGLARVLATQSELANFLSRRPALLQRIADGAGAAPIEAARERQREVLEAGPGPEDLEGALDLLRVLRREEQCLAACADLGGLAPFEAVSQTLSALAETIAERALTLAQTGLDTPISVLGMGKIAGRELTYQSDLDLIFLYQGGADAVDAASRVGQRLISYLNTMTGAGIAYAVDARLRPSGQQGMLVTSYSAFEAYQCERAQTWEHLAGLRARAICGDVSHAQLILDRVHGHVLASHENVWSELADLRKRVEVERAAEAGAVAFKTGPGGLMDVDFLAGGGLLERGTDAFPSFPGTPALLRAAATGPAVDALIADYGLLRRVEARTRFVTGRANESLPSEGDVTWKVAELIEPGLAVEALLERVRAALQRVRSTYEAVIAAGSIAALDA